MKNVERAVEHLQDLSRRMRNAAKIGEGEEEIVFSSGFRPFETITRVFNGLSEELEEIIALLESEGVVSSCPVKIGFEKTELIA